MGHHHLWKKIKSYVKQNFQISLENPLYDLRLTNTIQMAIEVVLLQRFEINLMRLNWFAYFLPFSEVKHFLQ